jgi:hypothetical protein
MKVHNARHVKRERLRSGLRRVVEQQLVAEARRSELAPFFLREHHLCRFLALRYAESVVTVADGFPEGDAPEDVVESHVDALSFHDDEYSKGLFATNDRLVHVLRGTCTVARRFYQWLDDGDIFTLGGRQFRVTDVRRERVADVTPDEARLEGLPSLAEWKRVWSESLPLSAGNDATDQLCFRHEFVATDLAPARP